MKLKVTQSWELLCAQKGFVHTQHVQQSHSSHESWKTAECAQISFDNYLCEHTAATKIVFTQHCTLFQWGQPNRIVRGKMVIVNRQIGSLGTPKLGLKGVL